jgi:hypothetical protein
VIFENYKKFPDVPQEIPTGRANLGHGDDRAWSPAVDSHPPDPRIVHPDLVLDVHGENGSSENEQHAPFLHLAFTPVVF